MCQYVHTAHLRCILTYTPTVYYQEPVVFWMVTGFMFLGSGLIWRRLLSFLGRHLEPSVPSIVMQHTQTHKHTIMPNERVVKDQVLSVISPVCDTDPSSMEEKSESVRHQGGSQMMFYLRSVKCHRPPTDSAALETIVLPSGTSWILYKGWKFSVHNTPHSFTPPCLQQRLRLHPHVWRLHCVCFCVPVISDTWLNVFISNHMDGTEYCSVISGFRAVRGQVAALELKRITTQLIW